MSRVENATSLINAFSGLVPIFSGGGTRTSSASNLDPTVQASLAKKATGDEFSKDAAIDFSDDAVQQILKKLLETNVPTLASSQRQSGVFDDTTTQLLLNDLNTRAAAQGALVRQKTVKDFSDIQNQAANTLKGSQVNSTVTQGPAIEDPLSALLKVGGLAIGGSLLNKGFKSIFSDDEDTDSPLSSDGNRGSDSLGGLLGSIDEIGALGLDSLGDFFDLGGDATSNTSDLRLPSAGVNIGSGGGSSDTIGASFDIGGFLSDAFGAIFGGGSSNSSSSGCFITTAICSTQGLPDDCEELTILRSFRDSYMKHSFVRILELREYYKKAPGLVKKFNSKYSKLELGYLYAEMYNSYIVPAVKAIKQKQFKKAHAIYKELFGYAVIMTED